MGRTLLAWDETDVKRGRRRRGWTPSHAFHSRPRGWFGDAVGSEGLSRTSAARTDIGRSAVLTEKSAGRRSPRRERVERERPGPPARRLAGARKRRRERASPSAELAQEHRPAAGAVVRPSGPVPDPDWDRVTRASWASFPASDA